MGSCENSVIVDEPVCVSISGQHLLSEFPMQSVSEQQSCLELSHQLIDSNMDLASAPSRSPDLVRNSDTTQVWALNGDTLAGGNEKTGVLALENLVKNDLGDRRDCLNENHSDIDVCMMEGGKECMKESRPQGEDGLGNLIGECVTPSVVIPVSGSPRNCDRQVDIRQVCTVNGDILAGETENTDVSAWGNLLKNDSGDGRGCLNGNQSDIDICPMESSRECLKESRPQGEDGMGNLVGDCETPLGVIPLTGLPINCCRQIDKRQVCSVKGEMLVGESENTDVPASENLLKNDSGDSRDCLNEDHLDIDVCTMDSGSEGLKESRLQGEDGLGKLVGDCALGVIPVAGLPINCDQQVERQDGRSANCVFAEGFMEGMENEVNTSAEVNSDTCEQELGVIPVTGLPTNCDQRVEQKDGRSANCLFAEGFMEGMENKVNNSAEVNSDSCEQESPLQDCESLELVPLNGVLGNTVEQNEQDLESAYASSLGKLKGKIFASFGSGDDLCNRVSPLQHGGKLLEISHIGEEVSNSDLKTDQTNCFNCLSVESNSEAVQMESNIDTSNQVSLSTSMENAYKYESPSICVQHSEHISDNSVDTPPNKWGMEFVEEKSDVTIDTKVVGMQMSSVEQSACNLNEGSSLTASKFVIDKSGSSQTSFPLGGLDDGSSKRLDEADQLGSGVHGPINSSSPVERYGQSDNQGKDTEKIDCASETKCYDFVSSPHQRNRKSRSNRKTQRTKATRKCEKTTKVSFSCGSIKIAVSARKKRSCLSKSARSSGWGLLGNVTALFENSNGLEVIQGLNQGSRKSNGGKKSGKQKKKGATIRSQGSRRKPGASNTNIRLKVKMGKEVCQSSINVTVPEIVDTSASSTAVGCDLGTEFYLGSPKVANDIVDDCGKDETAMHLQCISNNPETAKSCPGAFVSNDLDNNVVKEKSPRYGRDYFGVSSHLVVEASGRATDSCKDPGTSPDSEVINLMPDVQVDFRRHDDFHHTIASPKDLTAPGDLTSNKRGKKKHKLSGLGNGIAEEKSPHLVRITKPKPLKQYGRKQNSNNGISSSQNHISLASANASSNSLSDMEPLHLSEETAAVNVSTETLKVDSGAEAKIPCHLDTVAGLSKLQISKSFLPAAKTKGHKIPKGKSQGSDSVIKRLNARSQKEAQGRSVGKKKTEEKSSCDQVACKEESKSEAGTLLYFLCMEICALVYLKS